jgi:hypothetical protein
MNEDLSILGYNLGRSLDATETVLNVVAAQMEKGEPAPQVICLQEPGLLCWRSGNDGVPRHHPAWTLFTPSRAVGTPRALTYVAAGTAASDVRQVAFDSSDCVAVEVRTNAGWLRVVNVYNAGGTSVSTRDGLVELCRPSREVEHVHVGGDFNAHHHSWSSFRYSAAGSQVNEVMREAELFLQTELDLPTFMAHSGSMASPSTIDLLFTSLELSASIVYTGIAGQDLDLGLEHSPILTTYSFKAPPPSDTLRFAFRQADWAKLKAGLERRLPTYSPLTGSREEQRAELECRAECLVAEIRASMDEAIPKVRRNPNRTKRWWPPDEVIQPVLAQKRRAQINKRRFPNSEQCRRDLRISTRHLAAVLRLWKRRHWEEFLASRRSDDLGCGPLCPSARRAECHACARPVLRRRRAADLRRQRPGQGRTPAWRARRSGTGSGEAIAGAGCRSRICARRCCGRHG